MLLTRRCLRLGDIILVQLLIYLHRGVYASFPSLSLRKSASFFGIRTAKLFPVFVIFVFTPNPYNRFCFSTFSIFFVVSSSVNFSLHFLLPFALYFPS